uniref:11K-like protein n=1 Tax=Iragoides fasciata nucleopolyhedrovirus TaxID=571205 RepID=B6VC33_9ABAC|nr:11K-like protein [Iragoides fasciata nucleopolyhedrovirus]
MNVKLLVTFGLLLLILIVFSITIYFLNLKNIEDDNNLKFICQESSGMFAHPTRCDAFYMCVGFYPIKLFCPIDYEFDETQKLCLPKFISNNKCNANKLN